MKRKTRGIMAWVGMFGVVLAISSMEINARPELTIAEQIAEEDRMAQLEELAILCHAEAGNQSLEGRRMVVATVLNRVDDPRFPDNIHDVIFQEGQFSCINDGGYSRAMWTVEDMDFEAVRLELENRSNYEVLFFRTGRYHSDRRPVCKIQDHFFSK